MSELSEVWPAHPKPLTDEIFSSWILRLSRANAIKLSRLIRKVSTKNNLLGKNIDLTAPYSLLESLAVKSRLTYQQVWETSLRSYEGRLFERFSEHGQHAICLLDTGETRKHRPFQQFCPICLSEAVPYYRKHWRISFVTVCPDHHCLLHDRCPLCHSPVLPLKNDTIDKHKLYTGTFSACHNCQFDLRESPVFDAVPAVVLDTLWYLSALKKGYACIQAGYWVYSFSIFAVLRQLMRMKVARMDDLPAEVTNLDIDHIPLQVRYQSLMALTGTFSNWPEGFEAVMHREKGRYYILKEMKKASSYIPFWADDLARKICHKPNIPVPEKSVLSAIEIMNRRGMSVNLYSVNRFMGTTDSTVIKRVLSQRGGC